MVTATRSPAFNSLLCSNDAISLYIEYREQHAHDDAGPRRCCV